MTIVDLFNSVQPAELEDSRVFPKSKKYCYSDVDKLKKSIEKIDAFIQNLLDTKEKARKINCIQNSAGCNPFKFHVDIHLGKWFSQFSIDKKYKEYIVVSIYSIYSKQDIEMLKDDKKYKHIYKVIKKAEELTSFTSTDVYISNYEFFIYTINRLIDFLRVAKEDLKENLDFLTKEIC